MAHGAAEPSSRFQRHADQPLDVAFGDRFRASTRASAILTPSNTLSHHR